MLFKAAPKHGGSGLVMLMIVLVVLYYSGAGAWLWQRVQRFGDDCYGMVAQLGVASASPACGGISKTIAALDGMGQRLGDQLHDLRGRFWLSQGDGVDLSLQAMGDRLRQRLAGLGSDAQTLARMMGEGPQALAHGSAAQQLRNAVDSFSIGQQYLQSGSATQALPWLRQGAALPSGYGLMSQLSLGDMYSRGASGIAPDPVKAQYYYQQAQQSLSTLTNNPTPQGQQLLEALPASPQVVAHQLGQTIQQLQLGR